MLMILGTILWFFVIYVLQTIITFRPKSFKKFWYLYNNTKKQERVKRGPLLVIGLLALIPLVLI